MCELCVVRGAPIAHGLWRDCIICAHRFDVDTTLIVGTIGKLVIEPFPVVK